MLMQDNKVLRFLVGFTAIAIAICSASFSIYGLSLIFSGISAAVIVMASVIELGKIVSVAFLYQRWKTINWAFRSILGVMIITCMIITSAGIFGILSSGYEISSVELNTQENKISLLNNKKTYYLSQIKNLESQKLFYEQRAIQLASQRSSQERRLDSLNARNRSEKSTLDLINKANIDIDSANKKIDRIILKTTSLNDSIQKTDEIIQTVIIDNNKARLDPLKYLSRITSNSMDNIIKWLIALFISIFDPAAVVLLMAFSQMTLDKSRINKNIPEKKESSSTKQRKKKDVKINNDISTIDLKEDINIDENNFESLKKNAYIYTIKEKDLEQLNSEKPDNKSELDSPKNISTPDFIEINNHTPYDPPAEVNLSEKLIKETEMNTTNNMENNQEIPVEKIQENTAEKEVIEILKTFDPPRPATTHMNPDGGMVPN
jgi:hypothetical protein